VACSMLFFKCVTIALNRAGMVMIFFTILLTGEVWQRCQWFLTAQPYEGGWRMHPIWFGSWGVAMMWGMMLFWALMIGACIVGLRWFFTYSKSSAQDHAMSILRERFARGEIEKDQFETRKQQLS
jgi:putative membrane protein